MALRLLSQLDAVRRERNPRPDAEPEEKGPRCILDQSELTAGIDEVLAEMKLSPHRASQCATFRTWDKDCHWPVDTLIGVDSDGYPKATAEIWKAIVRRQVTFMRDTIKHQQPNGDWQVVDGEYEIKPVDRVQTLRLAVRFVDTGNKEPLHYQDGKPVAAPKVQVHVNNGGGGLTPEMVAAIRGDGGGNGNGEVEDLKRQLAELKALVNRPKGKPGRKPKAQAAGVE